jgi:hypothetical protein
MIVFKKLHVYYLTAEVIINLNPLTAKVAKILRKVHKENRFTPPCLRVAASAKQGQGLGKEIDFQASLYLLWVIHDCFPDFFYLCSKCNKVKT